MAFLGNSSGFGRLVVGGIENWLPADRRTAVGWIMAGFWTRSLCFGLIIVSFWFWYKIFIEFKLSSLYFYFVLVLSLSPTLFGLFGFIRLNH